MPPHLWFVGSAIFHYLGPSFAVLLFVRVPVGGVAWLRIVSATYRAPATEARAKRYTATPLGTSDRKHLIGLIQNTTGRVAP